MRYLFALIASVWALAATAQDWEDRRVFNAEAGTPPLRVLSSTDTAIFAPVIESFVGQNANVAIEYLVSSTADVDHRFRAAPSDFDVVISSAMDLQLKLANDGYAATLRGISHPAWAEWRQSLFAFTAEPAAIVINTAAFGANNIPATRQELIQELRARPETFQGRVGTYDIRTSGLGYLFATQDARASETYWRLMEVMGGLDARLYCCSGEMIDDLVRGDIVVAYNVLGSYAAAREDRSDALQIILPSDFPTTMMRTAMVSRDAGNPEVAEAFVQHLLDLGADESVAVPLPILQTSGEADVQETIALEPALMTFLDTLKRNKFLAEWEDAIIQD